MGSKRKPRHVAGSTRSHVELLLAESVPSLGQTGDIVRVKPGFARNYLIPHGLATVATDENQLAVERHRQRQLNRQVAEIKELGTLAETKLRSRPRFLDACRTAARRCLFDQDVDGPLT